MGGFIIGSNNITSSPSGSGSVIIKDESSDFAPVNAGNTLYRINSVIDVTVTINEDSCPIGQCISFKRIGDGDILLSAGDIVFDIDADTSLRTFLKDETITVFHEAVGVYNVIN